MPEAEAYRSFFGRHGFQVDLIKEPSPARLAGYAVEWHFMGFDRLPRVPERIKIHEYISASLPPWAAIKNRAKGWFNRKPDLRVFHHPDIAALFSFRDEAPVRYREAGIGGHFFASAVSPAKEFDFVYLGSMDPRRQVESLLRVFADRFSGYTLLMVGAAGPLREQYRRHDNIIFVGQTGYAEVPAYLRRARYGINFIPDRRPFSIQPSLKLLEYCATGLPVISTSYGWVRQFARERHARFFLLSDNLDNFTPTAVTGFRYVTPDVSDLRWEKVLDRSRILPFLEERLDSSGKLNSKRGG